MPDINMQVFEEAKRNQLVTEVDIQTQVALDDYQVQLSDIANPTQSQDNVVIDRNGEFLLHWNESLDFDTWIKMSMEVAGKRILMLRGNSNVSSMSNGNNTFVQYHGSAASNFIDSLIINPVDNFVYEGKVRATASSHNVQWGLSNLIDMSDDATHIKSHSSNNYRYIFARNDGATTYPYETPSFTLNTDYELKITYDGTTIRGFVNDNEITSGITTNIPNENMGLFMSLNTGTNSQSWSFVRKYTTTEPTWTVDGAEQNIAVILKLLGRAG